MSFKLMRKKGGVGEQETTCHVKFAILSEIQITFFFFFPDLLAKCLCTKQRALLIFSILLQTGLINYADVL